METYIVIFLIVNIVLSTLILFTVLYIFKLYFNTDEECNCNCKNVAKYNNDIDTIKQRMDVVDGLNKNVAKLAESNIIINKRLTDVRDIVNSAKLEIKANGISTTNVGKEVINVKTLIKNFEAKNSLTDKSITKSSTNTKKSNSKPKTAAKTKNSENNTESNTENK